VFICLAPYLFYTVIFSALVYIQALVYADDVVIITNNRGKLQQAVTEWALLLEREEWKSMHVRVKQ